MSTQGRRAAMVGSAPEPPSRRAARRHEARVRRVLLVCFALIPLTFFGRPVLGLLPSGWAWLLLMVAVAPLALTEPLKRNATRTVAPYLAAVAWGAATLAWSQVAVEGVSFLVQLLLPAMVYLLAWRVYDVDALLERVGKIARVLLVASVAVAPLIAASGNSPRPLAISLVVIFVAATLRSPSWRHTFVMGALAVATAVFTGSRAATAVLMLVVLMSPSLDLSRRRRVAIVGLCLLFVAFSVQTTAFRERYFHDPNADITSFDALTQNLNTAGRRELWPQLIDTCSEQALFGLGLSMSSHLSTELSNAAIGHPHNEFLRTYCEVGLIASVPFWAFFVAAGIRSLRGVLHGPDRRLHGAAGQLIAALLLFALTDNPLAYTAHFMAPMAVLLGLSDSTLARQRHAERQGLAAQPQPAFAMRAGA